MTRDEPGLCAVLARGWRRRCPRCGEGRLFEGWIRLAARCPACGHVYLENQGDLWGYLVLVDRAVFIFPVIVMIYLRVLDPHAAWPFLLGGALVAVFVATLPHRNGLGVALDYLVRRRSDALPRDPY